MRRKIAVILATDIAGYSRLMAEDEEETLRRLAVYRGVLDEFISRSGGRIFNTAGDGFMAEFPSAVDAVRCAIDTQESLRTRNLAYPASRQMAFRMGLTIGDVVENDGDLLGDGVNIAARLQTLAEPGRICISKSVYDAVANKLSVKFNDLGPQQVKNIPNPVHVFSVLANPEAAAEKEKQDAKPVAAASWFTAMPFALTAVAAIAVGGAVAMIASGYLWPEKKAAVTAPSEPKTNAAAKDVDKPASSSDTAATAGDTSGAKKVAKSEAVGGTSSAAGGNDVASAGRLRANWWSDCKGGAADAAISACQKLIGDGGIAGNDLALAHEKLAMAQRQSGHLDDAITSFNTSIGIAESSVAYNERGTAYFLKGRADDALADYDRAIALDANNGDAYNNRAWAYFKQGKLTEAKQDADKAQGLIPDKADLWDTRGHILEALGNRPEAIKAFQKALSINPSLDTSSAALKRLGAR